MLFLFKNVSGFCMKTYIVIIIILLSCSHLQKKSNNIVKYKNYTNINKILNEFKIDSLGCLGLRSKYKINLLIDSLNLRTKSKENIIEILGEPNQIITFKNNLLNQVEIFYIFNTYCDEMGKPIMEYDHQWINFVISLDSNKVIDIRWGIS